MSSAEWPGKLPGATMAGMQPDSFAIWTPRPERQAADVTVRPGKPG